MQIGQNAIAFFSSWYNMKHDIDQVIIDYAQLVYIKPHEVGPTPGWHLVMHNSCEMIEPFL